MCAYVDKYSKLYVEMPFETVKRVFREIKDIYKDIGYLPLVNFTGGEPYIMNEIDQLLIFLHELGYKVQVVTNATLLKDRNINTLLDLSNVSLRVSLDGPERIHNIVRSNQNCFNISLKNVKSLFAKGFPFKKVVINYAVSSLNYETLCEFVEYIVSLGWKTNIEFEFLNNFTTHEALCKLKEDGKYYLGLNNLGCCFEETELHRIDIPVLINQIKKVKLIGRDNKLIILFKPEVSIDKLEDYFYSYDSYIVANKCYEPWRSIRMQPDGRVVPCGIDIEFGNLTEKNIRQIYYSEGAVKFRDIMRKNHLFSACRRCCKLKNKEYY